MTLVLPMWYLYGAIVSIVLKIVLLSMFWYRARVFPIALKHIPGALLLISLDAVLSWVSVALILHATWKSEKEFWTEFKKNKEMRLGRG